MFILVPVPVDVATVVEGLHGQQSISLSLAISWRPGEICCGNRLELKKRWDAEFLGRVGLAGMTALCIGCQLA